MYDFHLAHDETGGKKSLKFILTSYVEILVSIYLSAVSFACSSTTPTHIFIIKCKKVSARHLIINVF